MDILNTAAEVRARVASWRAAGQLDRSASALRPRIAFVPTMGALHAGHLALVEHGRAIADRVLASVFVNPTQFGPHEDFARYPRQPEKDAAALEAAGCSALFLPAIDTIYPPGHATFVEPVGAAEGLEGALRPGHFRGVATVVAQLFHLVDPDVAIFGEKDAQQLAVVRQMSRDLHFRVEVVGHPTVRECDGLAMSSRNAYLNGEDRSAAPVLHRALDAARAAIAAGERDAARLRDRMIAIISAEPRAELQYAEVVDFHTFRPLTRVAGRVTLPIAARFGATRLIDNLSLTVDD